MGDLNTVNKTGTVLIVVALPVEARPLVSALNLKFHSNGKYRNDEFTLTVTGVGRISSAISTTKAFSLNDDYASVLNFGLCGSRNPKTNIGAIRYVNRIREVCTGRDFFPDPLIAHEWEESAIQCHDRPVQDPTLMDFDPFAEIVDMESAGFFQAASLFLPVHSIHCIKVVSDHLDTSRKSTKDIEELINNRVSEISKYLRQISRPIAAPKPKIPCHLQSSIDTIAKNWRLTKTQVHTFHKIALGASLRKVDFAQILKNREFEKPMVKVARNLAFKNLCRELAK
jgi:adenosylhomocysteine nucleosidase